MPTKAELPSRDHHQVVHDSKPVTGGCIGDGTEGGILRFRGMKRLIAATSDKDAAGCLAGGGAEDHRAGREAGCLNPADGDDGVSDKAVTVVHVEDERHVRQSSARAALAALAGSSIRWGSVRWRSCSASG